MYEIGPLPQDSLTALHAKDDLATEPSVPDLANDLASIDPRMSGPLDDIESSLAMIDLAEDEILAAQRRHGERPPGRDCNAHIISETGPLWRSFRLLKPTPAIADLAQFVYRAHCRELLDRVAQRRDTRPATDAEMMGMLHQCSLIVPLHGVPFSLFLRVFTRCSPQRAAELFDTIPQTLQDYERFYGSQADDLEAELRRRVGQPWRTPAPPEPV